jgi:hypothetical protein
MSSPAAAAASAAMPRTEDEIWGYWSEYELRGVTLAVLEARVAGLQAKYAYLHKMVKQCTDLQKKLKLMAVANTRAREIAALGLLTGTAKVATNGIHLPVVSVGVLFYDKEEDLVRCRAEMTLRQDLVRDLVSEVKIMRDLANPQDSQASSTVVRAPE